MDEQASVVRKRRHLSPEEKFQIFMEALWAKENGTVGEVLRRWGIHSSDLVRIRRTTFGSDDFGAGGGVGFVEKKIVGVRGGSSWAVSFSGE